MPHLSQYRHPTSFVSDEERCRHPAQQTKDVGKSLARMTKNKYKKLESIIDKENSALLSVDFERLNQLYEMITVIYHRNKNQHNMGLYFKHVKRIRLFLLSLISEEQHSESSSTRLYGLIKYNPKFNKRTVKAMIYDFYNVINAKTFINLAIVMITVIAEIFDVLIVNYVGKIDSYLQKQKNMEVVKIKKKLRIMTIKERSIPIVSSNKLSQEVIVPKNYTETAAGNDDLGEEIGVIMEEVEPMPESIEAGRNKQKEHLKQGDTVALETFDNKVKKKSKKRKNKKGKSLIDDIFSGF